jgi:hypothetical protein
LWKITNFPHLREKQGQSTAYCYKREEKHLFSTEKRSNNSAKWSGDHMREGSPYDVFALGKRRKAVVS